MMGIPAFLTENLISELVITIIGVILARPILGLYYEIRYGGWTLTLVNGSKPIIENKKISTGKIRQIREIPEELSVYLKGVCSPFHRVECDIMDNISDFDDGFVQDNAFVIEDRKARRYIINIANDQKPKKKRPAASGILRKRRKLNPKKLMSWGVY